jgi:hypothetical protein
MKRIGIISLACSAIALCVSAGSALATPDVNGATIETRTFNDCPLSTVVTSNNYPASITITDAMDPLCVGFANLHSFSFSDDGGATAAVFNNNSNFRFGADFKITGAGEGEGGLRISPWYGKFVDGRIMANATTGEIACFGGALPFYSFTVNHGITYTRGTTIRLEATYRANDLFSTQPASIQYRVIYNGNTYDSPELPFGEQNPAECDPNGLWGMLNDGRVGGYFQPRANTGASLTATWTDVTFDSNCMASVGLDFQPQTLNLNSHAKWLTAYLEPAAPYGPADIEVSTVCLNGSVHVAAGAPVSIGDQDHDGIPDLALKFSRADVAAALSPGAAVGIEISGSIGEDCFVATDAIKVIAATLPAPAAGSLMLAGSVVGLTWEAGSAPATVDVIVSGDDGATWSVNARDVPNTGSYDWSVPSLFTDQARVAVVNVLSENESGIVTSLELGESATFRIEGVTGVGSQPISLGLHGVQPNPGLGSLNVMLSLPSASPARLALYDVAGREVASRDLGGLGTGRHVVTFGQQERLRPGVYLVKLSQGGLSLKTTAVVIE